MDLLLILPIDFVMSLVMFFGAVWCEWFAAPHGTFASVRSRTSLPVRQGEQAEICGRGRHRVKESPTDGQTRARPRPAEQTELGNLGKEKVNVNAIVFVSK